MTEVSIEGWLLNINKEKTKALYMTHLQEGDQVSYQNFVMANEVLNEELLHFSNILGLNLQQPTLLQAFPVDGQQIMYSGHYTVYGEILEGEMDAWDVIIGEHCFSLVAEESVLGLTEPHFQIGFEVVLQWLLPQSLELMKK
ncbi:hypothetical protein ACE1MS_18715 [Lysinibacillus sp. fkY74-1]|uniref:Uncharacterized protein n=3 Tax=Lysinibacillus TaxID=400634 RepID=B1HVN3_LYSSC|nr:MULTISPECIES: hypothetical protein [Lysinibacillus]MBE5084318.1 hypothetical protein [Bacillus thuringiensis]ACA38052.1 hypothetical protein Bsph_0425 [Lysinibacillus sphaericus C3-41]AMO32222.1 hypothetical protein AR327_06965 [Lysinibacillus sphaericus]AMR92679.1 hypothetical protein A1T07_22245 [Lysinibacillus sphaericus]ANA46728.1 hypothetical protein A2J09_14915 [Lysinibacillus sphaericus]